MAKRGFTISTNNRRSARCRSKMHAWLIRPERFGEPYRGVRARGRRRAPDRRRRGPRLRDGCRGQLQQRMGLAGRSGQDVIAARNKAGEPEEFHIGGSDASGIVYKVGQGLERRHQGGRRGRGALRPMEQRLLARARRRRPHVLADVPVWGYETNWGSFAQFTKVQAHQCLPRPKHLSWAASASYMLVGATAYRMLMGWGEHSLRPGDPVLISGAAPAASARWRSIRARAGWCPWRS